jgi:hypothetical protein
VGVSVSRIINFRDLKKKYKGIFTIEELRGLLYKKLYGVIVSNNNFYKPIQVVDPHDLLALYYYPII